MNDRIKFVVLTVLAQVVGILAMTLVGIWMGHYLGGFAWYPDSSTKFNYHPLFLTLGLVFIYGDAILVYRIFRTENKKYVKLLHMGMQLAALTLAVVGLKAVFSAHADAGYANLYSIHSWIGIITVTLFGLQFVLGFVFYLFPGLSDELKTWYMSAHRYWGVAIFVMATATALIGTMEEASFKIRDYSSRTDQTYVVNFMGLSLLVYGLLITYLVTKPEYERGASEYVNIGGQL
ncbi:transmembrane ascorbate-dependent reductase CYB561-like [Watersipora subatra]|uniref:transmembrane ascorbate-dependent reductase CYB561-like n=1 Tax=Watersipora subatra TaxID=2589382 RepID=UPI00355C3EFC